jgi:NAD+ synthase (glutamine-hydrolysing)
MKIALAQCNFHIGNFHHNEQVIAGQIDRAREAGADLVVFSELAVCGYPPYDLLESDDFISRSYDAMDRLARMCNGIAAIIGGPFRNPASEGKSLFNAAWFLCDGIVKQVVNKTLLPTYDVFDEYRYFEPAVDYDVVIFNGLRIAVTVCEDLWDVGEERMYTRWPMEELKQKAPDLIVNISASPYHHGQVVRRHEILSENARRYNLPLFYVNQVGAHTDLLFDGGSLVMNDRGEVVRQLAHFEEDFLVVDFDEVSQLPVQEAVASSVIDMARQGLVMGIRDFFGKLGFEKAVIGLSGGIDSALVMVLAAEALGAGNVLGVMMPSRYSSDHSREDARLLAATLGSPCEEIPIELPFSAMEEILAPAFAGLPADIAEENIQARIRGVILMAISNKKGHILLNTSNKSEAAVGYGTLYGDMCGALSVIGDLYKDEVYAMAEHINKNGVIIPENSIHKPPSAELRPDQKDADSLPPYPLLDPILRDYIEEGLSAKEIVDKGANPDLVTWCLRLVNMSEHKRRQSPPVLRVSKKAFGYGRRMPLVSGYRG